MRVSFSFLTSWLVTIVQVWTFVLCPVVVTSELDPSLSDHFYIFINPHQPTTVCGVLVPMCFKAMFSSIHQTVFMCICNFSGLIDI